MSEARAYLGERARHAAALLNSEWGGKHIHLIDEGRWRVPVAETAWHRVMSLPSDVEWDDSTLVRMAEHEALETEWGTLDAFIAQGRLGHG